MVWGWVNVALLVLPETGANSLQIGRFIDSNTSRELIRPQPNFQDIGLQIRGAGVRQPPMADQCSAVAAVLYNVSICTFT